MNLEKYRRLYPKIRLSWSLYQKFMRKDMIGIFDYLTDKRREGEISQAMAEGSRIHTRIQKEGIRDIVGIEKLLNTALEYKYETKITLEREGYQIICVPDLHLDHFVLDWKTGGTQGYEQQLQLYMWAIGDECQTGYLVPIKEQDGIIKVRRGIKEFKRSKYAPDWEDKFYDMNNDINKWIKEGQLEKYILNYKNES